MAAFAFALALVLFAFNITSAFKRCGSCAANADGGLASQRQDVS